MAWRPKVTVRLFLPYCIAIIQIENEQKVIYYVIYVYYITAVIEFKTLNIFYCYIVI